MTSLGLDSTAYYDCCAIYIHSKCIFGGGTEYSEYIRFLEKLNIRFFEYANTDYYGWCEIIRRGYVGLSWLGVDHLLAAREPIDSGTVQHHPIPEFFLRPQQAGGGGVLSVRMGLGFGKVDSKADIDSFLNPDSSRDFSVHGSTA